MITFAQQLEAMRLATKEAVEGWWEYISRTRDKSPKGYQAFRDGRLAANETMEGLAYVESVVGYEAAMAWFQNGIRRAREVEAEREGQS